jgi:hypothetical protein
MRSVRELCTRAIPAAALVLLSACDRAAPPPDPSAAAGPADTVVTAESRDLLLTAACDTVGHLMAAAMTTELHAAWGAFSGSVYGVARHGCTFAAADSLPPDIAQRPLDRVWAALELRGWQQVPAFSAEGPEGRLAGVRRDSIICVLQHFWNAGSDDERAAEWTSPMWYEARAECFRETSRATGS